MINIKSIAISRYEQLLRADELHNLGVNHAQVQSLQELERERLAARLILKVLFELVDFYYFPEKTDR
jgi:hypothetical protein